MEINASFVSNVAIRLLNDYLEFRTENQQNILSPQCDNVVSTKFVVIDIFCFFNILFFHFR